MLLNGVKVAAGCYSIDRLLTDNWLQLKIASEASVYVDWAHES